MLVISTHPSDHRHTNALKAALKDIDAPGWAVVFGDRHEMCVEALRLHYEGVKLVHVGGGDTPMVTWPNAHPDHYTRNAISALAQVHCVANEYALGNLRRMGFGVYDGTFIKITGSPGLDEVVAYAKTLDPNRKREGVFEWYPERGTYNAVLNWGEGHISNRQVVRDYTVWAPTQQRRLPLQEFLHEIAHCELFVTNSSAGLYEAPILNTPVELIGDRQAGRRGPYHHPEGRACEAIRKVIEDVCVHRS